MLLRVRQAPGYFVDPETGDIWSSRKGRKTKLAGGIGRGGYRIYSLMFDGRQKMFSGHRLVATAVYGDCPSGMECCHINGNPRDNRATNLKWATSSENNSADKRRLGRLLTGEAHQNHVLTHAAVADIRAERRRGVKLAKLAERYGVTESTVSRIALGKAWAEG